MFDYIARAKSRGFAVVVADPHADDCPHRHLHKLFELLPTQVRVRCGKLVRILLQGIDILHICTNSSNSYPRRCVRWGEAVGMLQQGINTLHTCTSSVSSYPRRCVGCKKVVGMLLQGINTLHTSTNSLSSYPRGVQGGGKSRVFLLSLSLSLSMSGEREGERERIIPSLSLSPSRSHTLTLSHTVARVLQQGINTIHSRTSSLSSYPRRCVG